MLEGMGVPGRGVQRLKNWDNCNSIINKIYLKKERKKNFQVVKRSNIGRKHNLLPT